MKSMFSLALIPALALAGVGARAAEPIKIGQVVTVTGSNAPWGIPENNALKDEVARINAAGGILGRQVKLIDYDYKGDQLEAVNVTKRLIGDGVCAIIGASSSGPCIAMSAVTEAAGVPFISPTATNPKVTFSYDTHMPIHTAFRACFIDPFQGSVAAQFIIKDLKAKTCAILFDVGSDYSQGLEQYFREAFLRYGGTIVAREGYRSGEVDFRAVLGKIKPSNPDVIYLPTDMTQAAMVTKQARQLGLKCTFFGDDSDDTPDLVSLAGPASEGFYLTNLCSLEDPAIKGWIAAYTKKYGAVPILPNCVMAVDAMRAVAAAITKAGSDDPAKIITALEQLRDVPVLTGKLTIDPITHNPINKPCVIETVKGGQIKFVKTITKVQ
ncbi:MAG: ABC transporter substrate-binding protein [Holophaga sp.]|jgi:branched-chain amino acid transport system substrate-binding protein